MTDAVDFQAAAATAAPASGAPSTPAPANQGDVVLVIEGRSYTRSGLETKIKHADEHIKQLESERNSDRKALADATEALKKAVSTQELIRKAAAVAPADQQPSQPEATQAPPASQAPSVDDITQNVVSRLEAKEAEKQRQANWDNVTLTLTRVYGDRTNAKVAEIAKANGMTLQEAAELARVRPSVFLRLFDEVNSKVRSGPSTFSSKASPSSFEAPRRGPSGYAKARSTAAEVAAYTKRLQELTNQE